MSKEQYYKLQEKGEFMRELKLKNLFLQQSYLDSWVEYKKSLIKTNFINWDFVVLTASNEEQAQSYRIQIEHRIEKGLLPRSTHYAVLSDPEGKRVGSGGATFNVLKYIKSIEKDFKNKRILVIHSGGDSKRVPQYSVCGKLFSPVPRQLPNTNRSTLFDEFIIAMSGVPSRMKDGMLVLSGDVLLLFNPLQIDFQFGGVAAISIKETAQTGKNHGVFLNDNNGVVERFLHKLSVEELTKYGAVNSLGDVDIDTGAVLLDSDTLEKLYSLIDTEYKFNKFVNETARISFYGDFLYPLSIKATLEEYYKQAPEGSFNDELKSCRTAIWEKLKDINMKLLCLSPAEFIHFGTTNELLRLMTDNIPDFEFLNWSRNVNSNIPNANYAVSNSMIDATSEISSTSYIEDSYILGSTKINENCVIANITLNNVEIPKDIVMHALKLKDGRFVVRIYGVNDNPKGSLESKTSFLCTTLNEFSKNNVNKIWDNDEHYLWFANLYIPASSIEKAVQNAIILYKIADKTATNEEIEKYFNSNRLSLYSSFNLADAKSCIDWQNNLADNILVSKFILDIENNVDINKAQEIFGDNGITQKQISMLLEISEKADFSKKIRIQYYLGKITKDEGLEIEAFKTIGETILNNAICNYNNNYKFERDEVKICLPVRVNWGGGWSDTPPYCNENGGTVLNAALKLNGQLPVEVIVKRLKKLHVVF